MTTTSTATATTTTTTSTECLQQQQQQENHTVESSLIVVDNNDEKKIDREEGKEEKSRTTTSSKINEETKDPLALFERDGFLTTDRIMPLKEIQIWKIFARMYFEEIFQKLYDGGHTPFPLDRQNITSGSTGGEQYNYAMGLGIKNGFREIVMRSPGRYEISLLDYNVQETGLILPSIDTIQKSLEPLIPNLLDANGYKDLKLCHLSLVVSTPGSTEQTWHADGGHTSLTEHLKCHVLNVFIPLTHLPLQLGPTEFRPGSHVYTRNLTKMMLLAKARKQLRPTIAPQLKMGDVLIFDYRVLHRGKANVTSSSNRPILVLTFSKPWYKDVCNFPKRSMYDKAAAAPAGCEEKKDEKKEEKEE